MLFVDFDETSSKVVNRGHKMIVLDDYSNQNSTDDSSPTGSNSLKRKRYCADSKSLDISEVERMRGYIIEPDECETVVIAADGDENNVPDGYYFNCRDSTRKE